MQSAELQETEIMHLMSGGEKSDTAGFCEGRRGQVENVASGKKGSLTSTSKKTQESNSESRNTSFRLQRAVDAKRAR